MTGEKALWSYQARDLGGKEKKISCLLDNCTYLIRNGLEYRNKCEFIISDLPAELMCS